MSQTVSANVEHGSPVAPTWRYGAFVSYSHAADGKLAPALQGALQRFAKRWFQVRAVRIFRDNSSLELTESLWGRIQDALCVSRYFILLASPAAAGSPWVCRELEFFLQHHQDPRRILIVVTDGEVCWDNTAEDFDWSRSSAVPRTLKGQFSAEPLFLDMRWARDPKANLSMRHAQFADAIATVAARIHGRPKDEIAGEDVVQHRRFVRVAMAAGCLLVALAAGLGLSTWVAVQQRQEAIAQRQETEAQRLRAEEQRAEAERQRDAARRQRNIAQIRQLASEATASIERWPQRSLLLAVEAAQRGRTAPRAAGAAAQRALDLSIARVRGTPLSAGGPVDRLSITPDGSLLAAAVRGQGLVVWDVRNPEPEARTILPWDGNSAQTLVISPDRRQVVFGDPTAGGWLWNSSASASSLKPLTGHEAQVTAAVFSRSGRWLATGDSEGKVLVRDPSAASAVTQEIETPGGPVSSLAFAPNETTLYVGLLGMHGRNCLRVQLDAAPYRLETLPCERDQVNEIAFSPDGDLLAIAGQNQLRVWDGSGAGAPIILKRRGPVFALDRNLNFTADGRYILASNFSETAVWDRHDLDAAPTELPGQRPNPLVLRASPTKPLVAAGYHDGVIQVWDLSNGLRPPQTLPGHEQPVLDLAFANDGLTLASGSVDGQVRLWGWQHQQLEPIGVSVAPSRVSVVAFSPDSVWLAAASDGDSSMVLLRLDETSPLLQRLDDQVAEVLSLFFTEDSRRLVVNSWMESNVWRLDGQPWLEHSIADVDTVAEGGSASLVLQRGHEFSLLDLDTGEEKPMPVAWPDRALEGGPRLHGVSGDGRWLAISYSGPGRNNGRVAVIDTNQRPPALHNLTGTADTVVWTMELSRERRFLGARYTEKGASWVKVWDLESVDAPARVAACKGEEFDIFDSTRRIAFARYEGSVLVAPVNDCANPSHRFGATKGFGLEYVADLSFNASGTRLAAVDNAGQLHYWNLDRDPGADRILTAGQRSLWSVALSDDDRWVAAGGDDGHLWLWRAQLDELIPLACALAGRRLTEDEWKEYFGDSPFEPVCLGPS